MMDKVKSRQIYKHLMNGRILNKYQLNNSGDRVNHPLFEEVMGNLDDYRHLYVMSGYRLIEHPNYLYIVDDEASETKTEVTMKAYCLLLVIGKYLMMNNYSLDKITSEKAGLTEDDFKQMEEVPYIEEILEKARFTRKKEDGLLSLIQTTLVDREILLEKKSSKQYVLSEAGKAFFEELLSNSDSLFEEEENV